MASMPLSKAASGTNMPTARTVPGTASPSAVIDDEIVGQAIHFGRDVQPADDIPTTELITEMLDEGHVLVADHTMQHWPTELHLPGPVWDRDARDAWAAKGELDITTRASAQVDRLLEAYQSPETDPAIDTEARDIVRSGLPPGAELPA